MAETGEVYVVKDEGPAKQALTSLLTSAGIPTGTFDDAEAFLQVRHRLKAGCVITSFQARGMGALEFLRRLRTGSTFFPTIIVASEGEILQAVEAMKAGAATVLARPYGDEALLGAVRLALDVRTPTNSQSAQRMVLAALTMRERDVLSGLLDGKTNKMTARHLGISPRTVEVYRASVMKKTGLGSVAELVRMAVDVGRSH